MQMNVKKVILGIAEPFPDMADSEAYIPQFVKGVVYGMRLNLTDAEIGVLLKQIADAIAVERRNLLTPVK